MDHGTALIACANFAGEETESQKIRILGKVAVPASDKQGFAFRSEVHQWSFSFHFARPSASTDSNVKCLTSGIAK